MGNCFGCRDKSPAPAKGTGKSPPSLPISTGSSGTSGGSSGTSASAGGASSGSEDFRRWPGAGVGVGGRVLDAPRLRVFTLAELRAVTRGFKPEMVLGEGGFGRVYKGWADERSLNPAKSSAGVVVAVKKLNSESVQGLQEWQVVGGELSGQAAAPEPGEAAGVLRRGPGAAPRLRVHAQGQPREPPLPAGRRLRAAAVGHAAQDRRRRRARPRLPALAGDADHLPGLQGLQHPPRRRLQPQALGLWARQERARGGPLPRHHAGHRHLRLRGARVRRHGTPLRQERRLRLRRRPPRAAHGASGARHQQAQPPGEPRGVGAALHRRREEAHQPHGPAAGGAVPAQGRAPGCQARAPLPLRRPQVQACHGRRAGKAGGDRGHGGVERRAATQACNGGGAATVAVPWFLQALTVTHRSIRLCL